jgi:hypothetical protein
MPCFLHNFGDHILDNRIIETDGRVLQELAIGMFQSEANNTLYDLYHRLDASEFIDVERAINIGHVKPYGARNISIDDGQSIPFALGVHASISPPIVLYVPIGTSCRTHGVASTIIRTALQELTS